MQKAITQKVKQNDKQTMFSIGKRQILIIGLLKIPHYFLHLLFHVFFFHNCLEIISP